MTTIKTSFKTKAFAALLIVLISAVVIVLINNRNDSQQQDKGHQLIQTRQSGIIGVALTTPNGMSITLKETVESGTKVFYHFQFENHTGTQYPLLATNPKGEYQFVLAGYYGTLSSVTKAQGGTIPLQETDLSDLAHPDAPTFVDNGKVSDGWLQYDASGKNFTPLQVLYRYGSVNTVKCSNINDTNSCSPVVLYEALIWGLSVN